MQQNNSASDASMYASLHIRPFDPDTDVPRVVRLLRAGEIVDWEGEQTTEEDVRAELTWPNHDPRRDRWVIEAPHDPDILIGYGVVWAKTPTYADVFVAVNPSYRRRHIGRHLLQLARDRAEEYGVQRLGAYANTMNAAASAFLYRSGFAAVSSYWDLMARADMPLPEPVWPQGYGVKPDAHLHSVETIVDLLNRSYEGLWGHGIATEDWVSQWLDTASPETVLFPVTSDGQPVGICRFHRNSGAQPSGYIDAPGILPEHRHVALYVPLVLQALQTLWREERFPVRMESWGDDPVVVARYRDLGFETLRHEIAFALEL